MSTLTERERANLHEGVYDRIPQNNLHELCKKCTTTKWISTNEKPGPPNCKHTCKDVEAKGWDAVKLGVIH